jgi:hypothetical protein
MTSRRIPRATDPIFRPCELERTVARAHPGVRGRTCTVSTDPDGLVVTAELASQETDPTAVEQAIRLALAADHGIDLHRLVITRPSAAAVL